MPSRIYLISSYMTIMITCALVGPVYAFPRRLLCRAPAGIEGEAAVKYCEARNAARIGAREGFYPPPIPAPPGMLRLTPNQAAALGGANQNQASPPPLTALRSAPMHEGGIDIAKQEGAKLAKAPEPSSIDVVSADSNDNSVGEAALLGIVLLAFLGGMVVSCTWMKRAETSVK